MPEPRNNLAKLNRCRELLSEIGCDVAEIRSRRQLNWMLGKLTGVKFDWLVTEAEAFSIAWPAVEAALVTLASDPNLIHIAPGLEPFFPARRPAAGNVVSLAAWREKRRAVVSQGPTAA